MTEATERRPRRHLADSDSALAWLFLAPALVYIAALVALPFGLAVAFSLSDVTGGDPSFDWVGLQNVERIFDDPVFWRSLRNTFVFTAVSMFVIVVFGKVLANVLIAASAASGSSGSSSCCPGRRPSRCRRSPGCGCWTRSSPRSTGCCGKSG